MPTILELIAAPKEPPQPSAKAVVNEPALQRWCRTQASANGAEFLPQPWRGRKAYYQYKLSDGRVVALHAWHLMQHGWPKDIDRYLARSAAATKDEQARLAELDAIARNHGGALLSTAWLGALNKHLFRYGDGREFELSPMNLKTEGWPKNLDTFLKLRELRTQEWATRGDLTPEERLQELREIGEQHNAKLLTPKWLGARVRHDFLLENGEIYSVKPNQLRNYGWRSGNGYAEDCCRQVFEHIFGTRFSKTTDALADRGIAELPLDGYSPEIRVAFEYQGWYSHWTCQETMAKDLEKQRLCADNDILLVAVPAFAATIMVRAAALFDHTYAAICTAFEAAGRVAPAKPATEFKINLDRSTSNGREFRKLQELAERLGGKLLSQKWEGPTASYKWLTPAGEEITARKYRIANKGWPRNKLIELANWAADNGMKLLSPAYLGTQARYDWELADGTQITARIETMEIRVERNKAAAPKQDQPAGPDLEGLVARFVTQENLLSRTPGVPEVVAQLKGLLVEQKWESIPGDTALYVQLRKAGVNFRRGRGTTWTQAAMQAALASIREGATGQLTLAQLGAKLGELGFASTALPCAPTLRKLAGQAGVPLVNNASRKPAVR